MKKVEFNTVRGGILAFAKEQKSVPFELLDLVDYVDHYVTVQYDSISRVLRRLRQEGVLNYRVVDAVNGVYKFVRR